jgi:hypothetical protein
MDFIVAEGDAERGVVSSKRVHRCIKLPSQGTQQFHSFLCLLGNNAIASKASKACYVVHICFCMFDEHTLVRRLWWVVLQREWQVKGDGESAPERPVRWLHAGPHRGCHVDLRPLLVGPTDILEEPLQVE